MELVSQLILEIKCFPKKIKIKFNLMDNFQELNKTNIIQSKVKKEKFIMKMKIMNNK